MSDESTRWTVVVKKQTDINLRKHLAERGMRKGDLSKFIEDAVNRTVLRETVMEVREQFKGMSPEEIDALVDDALAEVRSDRGAYARRT
jgi:hypothetical protein